MKQVFAALGLIAIFTFCVAGVSEARNVALVIGNADYKESISSLENPENDAQDVARAFENHGYETVLAVNLGQRELQAALINFREKADAAEIAVVYYAGHGIEIAGQNYIVPIDARLSDQRSASLELIDINTVLDQISGASKLRMLVLDACRNNPFVAKMKRQGAGRNVGRGLSRVVDAGSETLIAFAAAAGEVTPDGEPGGNSPFTAAFLNAMSGPPVDVRILLGKVRDEMQTALLGAQPALYGSLGGHKIVINPTKAALELIEEAPQPAAQPEPVDLLDGFLATEAIGTLEAWDAFIEANPTHSGHAIYRLAVAKRDRLLREKAQQAARALAEKEAFEKRLAELQEKAANAEAAERERAAIASELAALRAQAAQSPAQPTAPTVSANEQQDTGLIAGSRPAEQDRSAVSAASQNSGTFIARVTPLPEQPLSDALGEDIELASLPDTTGESEGEADQLVRVDPAVRRDQAIRDLQVFLKERNCYRGAIDGIIGRGTTGGVTRLAGLTDVDAAFDKSSTGIEIEEVLLKFRAAPEVDCPVQSVTTTTPKKTVKRTPTRTSRTSTTRQRTQTTQRVAPAAPKTAAPVTRQKSDFADDRGDFCNWFSRGNTCD